MGGGGREDPLTQERMTLHEDALFLVERSGLLEDRLWDRHLPDVVELGGPDDLVYLLGRQPELAADATSQGGNLAFSGLITLLRARAKHVSATLWVDGFIAALVVGAPAISPQPSLSGRTRTARSAQRALASSSTPSWT